MATGAYGVSFGAVSVAAGLDVWQSCALSLLVFTGASQFALVGVIGVRRRPRSSRALSGLLLGTRNTLYGLKVAPLVGWRGSRRVAAAHLVIDESTAMTHHPRPPGSTRGRASCRRAVGVRAVEPGHPRGALAGDSLGDPRTYGLDAAVGGAFLGLLWPRLDTQRNRVAALLGAAVALSLVPRRRPAGVPVLAASVVALGMALIGQGRRRAPEEPHDLGWRSSAAAVGCYLLKLAGMSVPERVLAHPVVRRTADLLPVVLLAALVAVQVFVAQGTRRPGAHHRRPAGRAGGGLRGAAAARCRSSSWSSSRHSPPRWSGSGADWRSADWLVRGARDGPRTSRSSVGRGVDSEGRTRSPCAQHGPPVLGTPDLRGGRESGHGDRAPCSGDRVVLGAARAVEVPGGVQRGGPGTLVVGAGGHVDGQRAVPDLLRQRRGRCR